MDRGQALDGILFAEMINGGAANLKAHVKEVNDLNVFPIPDGDTGDNMLLTVMGGTGYDKQEISSISHTMEKISAGMLLSARGNSGVILSQFFEGIKNGFSGVDVADATSLAHAFEMGVKQAYGSVMIPTEGTILTVMREATEYAKNRNSNTLIDFFNDFIEESKRSLERTPELLPVLKKAGVIDSGGAGLIYIIEGMKMVLLGEKLDDVSEKAEKPNEEIDLDAFNADSVLEFGYCTELLVRLQNAKTDISTFNVNDVTGYLSTIGDSIVAVQNGSVLKIHVHTFTPHKVLAFCQTYGEFLKVKIENMSLQHNSIDSPDSNKKTEKSNTPRMNFGFIAVASGAGIKKMLEDVGVNYIIDGGQSMNPSTEDFISAFDSVNADTIFVYPNNSNIVLTAKQAAALYTKSDIRVIESKTIGAGYASLSMLDTSSNDADIIESELKDAMEGVVTVEISHCVRDANMDGKEIKKGDFIGFIGKELLSVNKDRYAVACEAIDKAGFKDYNVCIMICGKDADALEAGRIESYLCNKYRDKEVYVIDGQQDVYDYILILE